MAKLPPWSPNRRPPPAPTAPAEPATVYGLPRDMCVEPRWLVWRYEQRPNAIKPTKVPYCAENPRKRASSTDPATWSTYVRARAASTKADGIGFVLGGGFAGVDLDGCRDPETGVVAEWALEIIRELDSYTEVSPSGTGVHVIMRGDVPEGRKRHLPEHGPDAAIEMYAEGRYFTVTGQPLPDTPIALHERTDALARLHERYFAAAAAGPKVDIAGATWPAWDGAEEGDLPDHLQALLAEHAILRRYFDRAAALDGDDHSESALDWALARCAACYVGSAEDVYILTKASRLLHVGDDKAEDRDAYFRRTALKAWADEACAREREVAAAQAHPEADFDVIPDELLEPAPSATKAPPLAGAGLTDTGNAERFALEHAGAARYVPELRTWIVWDGRRWRYDVDGLAALELAGDTVRRLAEQAIRLADEDARKRAVAWAMASHAAQRRRAMLELARPALRVPAARLDADPLALNVANGILDLRTYELRPHAPEALHTKLAPTPYDPAARCPLWERFLERVLPDAEVRACLQRLLGYGLQGGQEAKCVGFVIGERDAGKSTAIGAVSDTLGHAAAGDEGGGGQVTRYYVAPANLEAFAPREGNRPELASLIGARFAIVNEVPRGKALEAATFKAWSGGDLISATPKYGHPLSFRPDALLLFLGNHMPELEFSDDAAWERVVLIPFQVTIPEAERDLTLRARFDRRGILAWLVEGHRQYRERGIDPPAACRAARADRRAKADPLAGFWDEATEPAPDGFASARGLYGAYLAWAAEEGIPDRQRLTRRAFVERAKVGARVRGYTWGRGADGDTRGWRGVRVRQVTDQGQGDPMFG